MTYSLGCCRQSAISDFKERTLNNSGFSAEGTLISSSTLPSRGKDSGIRDQVPEKTSPHVLLEAQDQRLGAEQDQLPCGPAGTSSGNCQETETCMVWVTRHHSLSNTVLQDTVEGGRRRGRQRKCWMDNVKEWTTLPMPELLTMASRRQDWKRVSAESSLLCSRRPNRSKD